MPFTFAPGIPHRLCPAYPKFGVTRKCGSDALIAGRKANFCVTRTLGLAGPVCTRQGRVPTLD